MNLSEKELKKYRESKAIKLVYKQDKRRKCSYAGVYWIGNFVVFPSYNHSEKEAVNSVIDYVVNHLNSLRIK